MSKQHDFELLPTYGDMYHQHVSGVICDTARITHR